MVNCFSTFQNIYKQNESQNFVQDIQYSLIKAYMSKQAVGHLLNFMDQILRSENTISQVKKEMWKITGFHPNSVYNRIAGNHQIITIPLFQKYLKDRVACNSRQLYDLFERFDCSRRGCISQLDFQESITQSGKYRTAKVKNKLITHQIQSKFKALLNVIIKSCRVLDVWRKQLECFPAYDLFKLINKSLTGVIGPAELFLFFYENGKQLNANKSKMLHQYLLRGCYDELTLEVFCENLKPLEFGQYQSYLANLQLFQKRDEIQKQIKCIQAQEAERHYYKQQANQIVRQEIHRQAALTREEELQKRIQDQIRTYNQLKFITKQKYHPDLTYQKRHLFQQENIDRYNIHLKEIEEKVRLKEEAYRRKINNADAVMAVETFKSQQKENRTYPIISRQPQKVVCQAELQKLVKKYAFSQVYPNLKSKMHVQSVLGQNQIDLF